jgi:hypothetical protein
VADELSQWKWLSEVRSERLRVWNYVTTRFTNLSHQLSQAEAHGQPLSAQTHLFRTAFQEQNPALHSEGLFGRRVQDIREAEGPKAAAMAYAVATRQAAIGNADGLEELSGAILVAIPGIIQAQALSNRLSRERDNLRQRAATLIAKLESAEEEREAEFQRRWRASRRRAIRSALGRFGEWAKTFDIVRTEAAQEIFDFRSHRASTDQQFAQLRATYEEAMRLKAPATYWQDKAVAHRNAETAGLKRLYIFFPAALVIIGLSFSAVALWLLEHPPQANLTALYFIISGGLATLAGVIFWIGRLMTKLYLSEHHLRIDAEERSIMTTTYLALTEEKAADDADRQIILAALFRSTPDGIVKDDGVVDVSLAALLSKLTMPTK